MFELAAIDISLFFLLLTLLSSVSYFVELANEWAEFVTVGVLYMNFIPIIFLLQLDDGALGTRNGAFNVSFGLCFYSFKPSIGNF